MTSEKLIIEDSHKKFASNLFNKTWDLLDKIDRTKEEDLNMIHYAHASRYHWGQIGSPLHFARGEWQISRVYAVLGFGASAIFHGQTSLDYCEKYDLGAFDTAFAHEAVARAYNSSMDKERQYHLALAFKLTDKIEEIENRTWLLSNLDEIKSA